MHIEEELESFFLVHDYQWRIDGVLRYPTADDLRATIDRAVTTMYDEPEGTQLEVGRLIVKKSDDNGHIIVKKHDSGFGVYVLVGEINDKND
jgi:hypothetical protein